MYIKYQFMFLGTISVGTQLVPGKPQQNFQPLQPALRGAGTYASGMEIYEL